MAKPLSENATKVINAVRTKRSIEDVMQITGMTKPALIGVIGGLKSKGLAVYADGVISLTEEGKSNVNRKRGLNPNKKTYAAFQFLATPEMKDLAEKSASGDRAARKQRVVGLMEHLGMSMAGANTYVGNYDKVAREAAEGAKA